MEKLTFDSYCAAIGKSSRTNSEGLTWLEWLSAATLGGKHFDTAWKRFGSKVLPRAQCKQAWLAGEDPTDWAYAFENGME